VPLKGVSAVSDGPMTTGRQGPSGGGGLNSRERHPPAVFSRPDPDPEPVDASLDLDLGFTLPHRDVRGAVEWAAAEGFDLVEVLLDGPHARARADAWRDPLADALDDTGLDLVVHLPFALDLGSPFGPVRDGAVRECRACLDLAADLDARKAVFHPSSDAWDLGWTDAERREFVVDGCRRVVRAGLPASPASYSLAAPPPASPRARGRARPGERHHRPVRRAGVRRPVRRAG
jgi:hypothetical protein